jgi:cellobiose phosphorylase
VIQYLLGVKPVATGLRVNPCIPAAWDGFEMRRCFRGKWITIKVENPSHVNQGVKSLMLNGVAIEGDVIPADKLVETNTVEVVLG